MNDEHIRDSQTPDVLATTPADQMLIAESDIPPEPVPSPLSGPQPVRSAERIAAVDVLRGVALLGILTMNIVSFGWPFSGYENPILSGGNDLPNQYAWAMNTLVFSGKMMSLFSMLFGAGLILMSERAAERGVSVAGVYYRRILWLLLFGLIHAYLIWEGDILFFYALCGLVLYPIRRFPLWLLISGGVVMLLISVALFAGFITVGGLVERTAREVDQAKAAGKKSPEWKQEMHKAWHDGMESFFEPTPEEVQKQVDVFRGGYVQIVLARAPMVFKFQLVGFFLFMLWGGVGRMLVGMGLMKYGVFSGERSWRFYFTMALFGYGLGLPPTVYAVLDLLMHEYNQLHAPVGITLLLAAMVPIALGHAAVVMMICKAGMLKWLTFPLAAVGRMALTNYLMQSLICTTFFYGYGFGYFGRLDRVELWGVVASIWLFQLIYSPIWLIFFRFGPAEWLWRTLTYWKWQPILNRSAVSA